MAIIQYGGIRIDVQANTQGVKALRTDMASLSREFAKTMTPVEKLESKLSKVAAQIKKHGEATVFTDRVTISAVNTYLEAEKAAGRYAEAIDFVAKRLPELAASMKQLEETRRRDNAMAAAAASAKRQTEVDKLVLQERIERERQAAALSKKIDKDMANEKVATQKAANDQQKQLMQQLSDVEEFFEQRSLARKKSYINHKLRLEKEALEAEKLAAKEASLAREALDEQERQRVKRRRREEYQAADAVFKKIDQEAKDRARAQEALDEQERQRVKRRRREEFQVADAVFKKIDQEAKNRARAQEALDEQERQRVKRKRREEFQAADAVFKKIEQESQARARAQRMVNATLRESISPVDQLRMRLEKLRAELDKGRISQEQFAAASKATEQQINKLQTGTGESSRMAQFATSFAGGLSPMGAFTAGAAGFVAGQQTLQFAKDSVTAYMNLRDQLVNLEVVMGSERGAKDMFHKLRQIAVASNMTSDAVMRSAVTMAQFGVSTDLIAPSMLRLSEISSGNADRLQSLSIALGQVAAAGRLTGQETLQFVNAGFSPLQEIARTTGKSMVQLRKDMEAGLISFDQVIGSLVSVTAEGGRFFGMIDKKSHEAIAQVNKLSNAFLQLKEAVGELGTQQWVLEPITESLKGLTFFVSRMKNDFMNLNLVEALLRNSGKKSLREISKEDLATMLGLPGSKSGPPIKTSSELQQDRRNKANEEAAKRGAKIAEQAAQKAKLEEERLKSLQKTIEDLRAGNTSEVQKLIELRDQLNEAAARNMISHKEAKSIFEKQRSEKLGLKTPETTAQQKFIAERDRIQNLFNDGMVTLREGNEHLNIVKKEFNQQFLDRAKDIKEALVSDQEKVRRRTSEIAGLVQEGFLTITQGQQFLTQQAIGEKSSFSSELPRAVSMGTQEAYELVTRANNQIQNKQIENQRRQIEEQKQTNVLLKEMAKNQGLGIVK